MPTQVGVVATGRQPAAHNFSSVVDVVSFDQLQRWIWRDGSVQVDDRVIDPNDSAADGAIAGERLPDDLSIGVDCVRDAEAVAFKSSKIDDLSTFPESCMEGLAAVSIRPADRLSRIIEPDCL